MSRASVIAMKALVSIDDTEQRTNIIVPMFRKSANEWLAILSIEVSLKTIEDRFSPVKAHVSIVPTDENSIKKRRKCSRFFRSVIKISGKEELEIMIDCVVGGIPGGNRVKS